MATKTITATVTLHVPGPNFKPFTFNDSGFRTGGNYDVVEAAPGTPVTLDEDEADRLIARGIAEEYVAPTPASAPTPVVAAPAATPAAPAAPAAAAPAAKK